MISGEWDFKDTWEQQRLRQKALFKQGSLWRRKPINVLAVGPHEVTVIGTEVDGTHDYVTFHSSKGEHRAFQGVFLMIYEQVIPTRYERLVEGFDAFELPTD